MRCRNRRRRRARMQFLITPIGAIMAPRFIFSGKCPSVPV
jgi:hypothetical protein